MFPCENEGVEDLIEGLYELSLDNELLDETEDSIDSSQSTSQELTAISPMMNSSPIAGSLRRSISPVMISPIDSPASLSLSMDTKLQLLQDDKEQELFRELTRLIDFSKTSVVSRAPELIEDDSELNSELVRSSRTNREARGNLY